MTESKVIATSRDAGRNVLHTVSAVRSDGSPAHVYRATRRSAHRYDFAICRWVTIPKGDPDHGGERAVIVDRWSNNAKHDRAHFAVRVNHA